MRWLLIFEEFHNSIWIVDIDLVIRPKLQSSISSLKSQEPIWHPGSLKVQWPIYVARDMVLHVGQIFPGCLGTQKVHQTKLNLREGWERGCKSKHSFLQSQCCYFSKIPAKSTEVRTSKIRPIRLNYCTLPRVSEKFNYTSIILRVKSRPCYITNLLFSIFVWLCCECIPSLLLFQLWTMWKFSHSKEFSGTPLSTP